MNDVLQQAWIKRGALARILWPVAHIYSLIIRLRCCLYRFGLLSSERVSVPVLVVGNVVAGGAGKTPLVIAVTEHLRGKGIHVGVVSRGYGRSGHHVQEVSFGTPVMEVGDEPLLIKRKTGAPVFVAAKRVQAARALLSAYPATQLLVCDDGLQHYALGRDIEVVVFDNRGVGNGWLLPAGPLREPWPSRPHRKTDLVIHTGDTPAFEGFTSSKQLADFALTADGHHVALSSLLGQPLVAVAAIANPCVFFAMLEARGLSLRQTISLPDHYDYASYKLPVEADATVLCTEKDAVKLFAQPAMASVRLLAVPLQFLPESAFLTTLEVMLAPLLSPLRSTHGH